MSSLTIDGKQYDLEKLPAEAKAKLESARFCEQKIQQLEAELSIVRTARAAYLQALPALLSDEALVDSSLKAVVKNAVEKKVAKKAAPKKAPAKKAPAKKAPAKKAASKKPAVKNAPAKKAAPKKA